MGTNYYLHKNVCPHCGRGDEPEHIGKSSVGWCFGLHVMPEEGINTLDDWRARWSAPGTRIKDEYGDAVTPAEMERIITDRRGKPHDPKAAALLGYASEASFMAASNNATAGPNSLWRHKLDSYCVGHGDGTWDYLTGVFS